MEFLGLSPVFLGIALFMIVAGIASFFFLLRNYGSAEENDEVIETEGMTSKLIEIFDKPAKTQGAKINDYIKIRSTSTTPRTIGLAIRAKDMDVEKVIQKGQDDYETETIKGTTYTVIEGSESINMKLKKLKVILGLGGDLETYDVPKNLITPGDDYIWLSNDSHFVKWSGVKRQLSVEGLSRAWETSFSKTHENYLRAQGDIPEQYATLNNRINGQLKLENIKSENFREFEKMKKGLKKLDAMEE